MASIVERSGKSGISFRVLWRHDGVQKSATFKSKDRALSWKHLIEIHDGNQMAAEAAVLKASSTAPILAKVAEHYFERRRVAPFTLQKYRADFKNHILPTLGQMPVDKITDDDVRRFIGQLEDKGLARKTMSHICGLLSPILDHAVKYKWAAANPYSADMMPKAGIRNETDKFLTGKEAGQIINAITSSLYADMSRLMLATGMRPSEILALDVSDVNLAAQQPVIRITKAMKEDRVKGRYVGPPKSARSVRSVGLPPSAVTMLRGYTEDRSQGEALFLNSRGNRALVRSWEKFWKDAVETARAAEKDPLQKRPKLYSLRHTHASMMLDAGMGMFKLSRHLGHESTAITEDVYAHLMPDAHYEAAQFAATFTGELEG